MSAISAIYVLDQKGKVLISRDYRGDVPQQCVDRFVQFISGEQVAPPCVLGDRLPIVLPFRGTLGVFESEWTIAIGLTDC